MPSLLPHGVYSLIPAVLSTIGWIASLSKDGCDYSTVSGPIVAKITSSKNSNVPFLQVGFVAYREPTYNEETDSWSISKSGDCKQYDPTVLDAYWQTAKAFAFAAVVIGGASSFFFWISTCFVFSRATWRLVGYQVMVAFLSQSLSFLWFGTSICVGDVNDCNLFYGSSADIAAAVLWFISSLLVLCRYPQPSNKREVVIHSQDNTDFVQASHTNDRRDGSSNVAEEARQEICPLESDTEIV
jgi:hypothetical protein